jgi:2-desacetyl-2-hydroxyethyl bacteriochlorophyllide A dehydrogenase
MTESSITALLTEYGQSLKYEELPLPPTGPNQVLVEIKACGICRGDTRTWMGDNNVKLPHTLGHEATGVVEEVGPGVHHVQKGDNVCLHTFISCGKCYFCLRDLEQCCDTWTMLGFTSGAPGAFTEKVVLPARNVYPMPKNIPLDVATVISSPLATAYSAVCKAKITPGDTVLIHGGGGIGFHTALAAKAAGAAHIYVAELSISKLKRLERLGINGIHVPNEDPVEKIREVTDGRGADVSFEAVGIPTTIMNSFVGTRKGGRVVFLGGSFVPVDLHFDDYREQFAFRELRIATSLGNQAHEISRIIELVSSGRIDLSESITARVPFDNITSGLKMYRDNMDDHIRIVVTMPGMEAV